MGERSSAYEGASAHIRKLRAAVARKDTPLRRELIDLIESGRHLVIGAAALARYVRPRFTDDVDYAVGLALFRRVRKWFKDHADITPYVDEGEALRCQALGVDVINAAANEVLRFVLKAERGLPSPEGLAACKYAAMTSPTRGRAERLQDAADLAKLVALSDFDTGRLLSFLVGPYEPDRPRVRRLISDLRAGRPIRI